MTTRIAFPGLPPVSNSALRAQTRRLTSSGPRRGGRLVFCGSPRRYEPRYFRSPPMMGVKNENTSCDGYSNAVAQAPDGLFLSCGVRDGQATWIRGDT